MSNPTPPEARVPRSTHVLLVSVMLFFFTFLTVFTLQAAWYLWIVPIAFGAVAAVILAQRWQRRQQRLAEAAARR
ncbi:hypothetical protein GIS00_03520 [Nakamurella sp. YIM 132087]|uniref:DUF2530 domain-containing protein n=1 Tax=Nakamurella alba TaxID=2665158 RepID=A0A7K1FFX2_9ACTN|nr:hypothetical protein [Nakamurella alba]MTD13015.1 hypothetical protein [Nakamurella alba]